jgi:imidazole glycerol-phosphate synthase subunit HisH
MTIAIIDYGSGNLRSAAKAFEFAVRELGRDDPVILTQDPDQVARADRIVLPGVGAFQDCKQGFFAISGMVEALEATVIAKARPFLGICVGMQLMATRGLEHGIEPGLDWVAGDVAMIEPDDPDLKIPHMGWNTLDVENDHPVLSGIETGQEGLHAYFVHSYALQPEVPGQLIATTDYGGRVTAIVARDNMIGTQFHPEKSQRLGLKLIANFVEWLP